MIAWRAAAVFTLLAPAARAQEIELTLEPCVALPEAFVKRAAEAELSAAGAFAQQGPPFVVNVSCEGSSLLLTLSKDSATMQRRALDLAGDDPKAHARLLALAIAELIASNLPRTEPAGSRPEPSQPAKAAPATPPDAPRSRHSAMEYALWVSSRGFRDVLMIGGAASVAYHAPGLLGVRLELAHERGHSDVTLGEVGATSTSGSLAILAGHSAASYRLESGLGARFGWVQLTGEPDAQSRGEELNASWGGPLAMFGGSVALGARLSLGLGAECGLVAREVGGLVDGREQLAIQGIWWGFRAGLVFNP